MKTKHYFLALIGALVMNSLLGCAAVVVPSTDDPAAKLSTALRLVEAENRPIPAERLIREAVSIYQETRDEPGLANAHRIYGIFYKSGAVAKWRKYYEQSGFLEPSARFDARYENAIEHFDKARALLETGHRPDMLANVELQRAWTYQLMRNTGAACAAFDASLLWHRRLVAREGGAKVVLPKEYASFEQGVADMKRDAGC